MEKLPPQERNQLIDEVIEGLKKRRKHGRRLSICGEIGVVLESNGIYHSSFEDDFNFMSIPIFRFINKYWWPPHDLESRILSLKSVKMCHK